MSPNPLGFNKTGTDIRPKVRSLTIYNLGTKHVLGVTPDPLSAPFSIVSPVGPFTVKPLHSVPLKLAFAPTAVGSQRETLRLSSSDHNHPITDVTLRGDGSPGVPYFFVDRFLFGKTGMGVSPKSMTLKLVNVGLGLLTGSVGTLSAPFTVTAGTGNYSLLPGQKLPITVEFTPTSPVHATATLIVTSSDPAIPDINLPLAGTGVGGHLTTNLKIRPGFTMPVLSFGTTPLSAPISMAFKIINNGKGLLQGSVGTPSTGVFSVISGGGPFTLEPEAKQSVTVKFEPNSSGKFTATLLLHVMSPSTPSGDVFPVLLRGHGS